jgi:hypothetical protein
MTNTNETEQLTVCDIEKKAKALMLRAIERCAENMNDNDMEPKQSYLLAKAISLTADSYLRLVNREGQF